MEQYSRADFIKELDISEQEETLREHIRRRIKEKFKGTHSKKLTVERLRSFIRSVLLEGQEDSPHKATGINVLEDLLKKIVPVLEQDYKQLTTAGDQRKSYRAHIVRAVQNSLAPTIQNSQEGPDAGPPQLQPDNELQEVDVDIGRDPNVEKAVEQDPTVRDDGYIDIDKKSKGGNKGGGEKSKKDDKYANFAIPGEDETGRNFAMKTFDKVERQIIDAYEVLSDARDQEIFYDYLLTNLKLYFDKFEDEMSAVVQEPTTSEYEQEKNKKKNVPSENNPSADGEQELPPESEIPPEEQEIPPEEDGVPTL